MRDLKILPKVSRESGGEFASDAKTSYMTGDPKH